MKTVIAAFSDNGAAQQAISLLRDNGIQERNVRMLRHSEDGAHELDKYDIPRDREHLYREVMRRGAPVIVADVPDERASQVASELDQLGSLDLDAAENRWKQGGWTGYDESAPAFDEAAYAGEKENLERESLDVIQEEVRIGKRPVERGVRIRTFVTERPVHETVELREEHIEVTREPVDQPISGTTDTTFKEDEFVVTATGEEAVVGKEARVVERVHVDKTTDVRTETIEETERRRDVEVENVDVDKDRPAPRR